MVIDSVEDIDRFIGGLERWEKKYINRMTTKNIVFQDV